MAAGQGDAGAGGDRPRYLTPSEVQEVMRRMWARNPGILNLLFAIDSGELVRATLQQCLFLTVAHSETSHAVLLAGVVREAMMCETPTNTSDWSGVALISCTPSNPLRCPRGVTHIMASRSSTL